MHSRTETYRPPEGRIATATVNGGLRARDSCAGYGADLRTTIALACIAKPCGHRFAGDSTGLKGARPEPGML